MNFCFNPNDIIQRTALRLRRINKNNTMDTEPPSWHIYY